VVGIKRARAADVAAPDTAEVKPSPDGRSVLAKLESLLAASPVGIAFLDRSLRYLRINDALAALNGHPASAHIGRPLAEMIPDSAAVLEPVLTQVMATGRPAMNIELERRFPATSEPRSYLATFFPVRSTTGDIIGVGGIVSDITDRRRAEEKLRTTQEQMQAILEHTPAAIWIKDATGRIVLANHRVADALGHPVEEVIGRRSEELLPPEIAAQHREHDELVARELRAIEAEESAPSADGMRTFLSLKFPLPGNPPMIGGIATEISDRKRIEAELRVAVRARDGVLAAVSHDLRNPLNTIQLATATLLGQLEPDQRGRRQLEVIQRSCLRMEHLIGDLLDMGSIAAGRMSVETRPESADDIVREAIELHQALASENKIALVGEPRAAGLFVDCDRQRILQVFENLTGNALKFCRAGDTVTIGSVKDKECVCFWVADTGPGIPPELLPLLFDPYRAGPGSTSGVGLGLYISRGIVERHGGRIDVASTPGQGARFSFTIPIAS